LTARWGARKVEGGLLDPYFWVEKDSSIPDFEPLSRSTRALGFR
jgi:hypothetical protein